MRALVISDIHANLPALDTVLETAAGLWDQVWFLGDLVGYGPDPDECVKRIADLDHIGLAGNHDWAVLGKLDVNEFNEEARAAVMWTRTVLSPGSYDYLDNLPALRHVDGFTLAHASPRFPIWEYVLDVQSAKANFAHFEDQICLIGHSHVPLLFVEEEPGRVRALSVTYDQPISLGHGRTMINPGSVGQPRDGDPRAAFALLDTETLTCTFHRIPYPIAETRRRMRLHKLPDPLAERLYWGW